MTTVTLWIRYHKSLSYMLVCNLFKATMQTANLIEGNITKAIVNSRVYWTILLCCQIIEHSYYISEEV